MSLCKILTFVSAMSIALAFPSTQDNCVIACPDNYAPVCGYDGQSEHKIFANGCEMKGENCKILARHGKTFTEVPLEMCEKEMNKILISTTEDDCPRICTFEYNPVCGFNGVEYQTFGNKCGIDALNCESDKKWFQVRTGECPKLEKQSLSLNSQCSSACPDNYMPVCGTDAVGKTRTYSNTCEFELYNCESNYQLRMLKAGEC